MTNCKNSSKHFGGLEMKVKDDIRFDYDAAKIKLSILKLIPEDQNFLDDYLIPTISISALIVNSIIYSYDQSFSDLASKMLFTAFATGTLYIHTQDYIQNLESQKNIEKEYIKSYNELSKSLNIKSKNKGRIILDKIRDKAAAISGALGAYYITNLAFGNHDNFYKIVTSFLMGVMTYMVLDRYYPNYFKIREIKKLEKTLEKQKKNYEKFY